MNDKLKADLNIGILVVFMLGIALVANYMGGQMSSATGATTLTECFLVSECDDSNACTLDTCFSGSCMYEKVSECKDDDGCCPANCADKDNDC